MLSGSRSGRCGIGRAALDLATTSSSAVELQKPFSQGKTGRSGWGNAVRLEINARVALQDCGLQCPEHVRNK